MRAGVAGTVSLILTIEVDGAVSNVEVEAGLGGGLTEAATAAARAARFRPATDGEGRSIRSRLRWEVRFTLPEQRSPLADRRRSAAASAPPPSPPAPEPDALPPGVERFPWGQSPSSRSRCGRRGPASGSRRRPST